MKRLLLALFLIGVGRAAEDKPKPVEPPTITPEMKKDYWKLVASKAQLETQAAKAAKDLEGYTMQLAQACEKAGRQLAGDATGDPTCTPKQIAVKPEEKKEK